MSLLTTALQFCTQSIFVEFLFISSCTENVIPKFGMNAEWRKIFLHYELFVVKKAVETAGYHHDNYSNVMNNAHNTALLFWRCF